MDFKYACRTCGNKGKTNDNQDACAKFKIKIDLSKDGCSWHTNEFITCATCGRQYNPNEVTAYITDTMEVCYVCKNCYSQFHTCGTCEIYPKCGFSEDRTEPQVVTKTIRQEHPNKVGVIQSFSFYFFLKLGKFIKIASLMNLVVKTINK